jgi:PAS domain S-box-containing protein
LHWVARQRNPLALKLRAWRPRRAQPQRSSKPSGFDAHLAAVVRGTQDAVLSKDLNAVITTWNPAAERLYGFSAEEAIGRHVSMLMPAERKHEEGEILGRVRRRERLETYETQRVRKDGTRLDVSLTVSPIEEPPGTLVGASVIARDVSAEQRRRRAQDFLLAASRDLDSSLDPLQTARNIVRSAIPELAEVCIIDFRREDGRIGDSVVAATEAATAQQLEKIRRESPLDSAGEHPVAQAVRAGRPMVWRDLEAPAAVDQVIQSDEHRALVEETGYSSAAVVPLVARGRTLGTVSFLHAGRDLRYDPDDLQFLAELGDRAALALDNARLYHERDVMARNLQRGLRPPQLAPVPGLEMAVVFEAAGRGVEIGGDFYDVLPNDDGCWILIGDVAGKGSAAAAVSVAVRHAVRGLTRELDEPEEVLARVNELLLEGSSLNDFATAILVRLRLVGERWEMTVAGAGHPPAIHLRRDGPAFLGGGSVLGAWGNAPAVREDAVLGADEALVLCTDGWLEAGASDDHREPTFLASMVEELSGLGPESLTQRLLGDVLARSEGPLRDDVVVLAVRPCVRRRDAGA